MKTAPLLLVPALILLAAAPLGAQLVNYTFDGLTAGTLVGQDSWTGAVSPVVAAGTGTDTTLGAINSTASTGAAIVKRTTFSTGSLTSSSVVTLSFDFSTTATSPNNNSYAAFGIGAGGDTAYFGVVGNTLSIRGDQDGTAYNPVTSGGALVTVTAGHLYTVQSVWDLSANGGLGSGTLYLKDLTAGQTAFTQLFFNTAQTQATISLGLASNPSTWTSVLVRSGNSAGSSSYLDNLSATVAVPEPSAAAFLGAGALVLLAAFRLRRRAV